jgi:hypothetical protein
MNVFTGGGKVWMDNEYGNISGVISSSFVLKPMTEFVTVKVPYTAENPTGMFPAFLGTTARHPIVKRYLELFWMYYAHQLPTHIHLTAGETFVREMLLRHAYDEFLQHERESSSSSSSTIVSTTFNYSSTKSFTISHSTSLELWQEVYYHAHPPKWLSHVPFPKWGNYVSCRYVVVTSLPLDYQVNDPTLTPEEMMYILFKLKQLHAHGDDQVPSIIVPFYSHIGDSRMCSIRGYQPI